MNQNLLGSNFVSRVKFTRSTVIQLSASALLCIIALIVGFNAYADFRTNYKLNNALEKYNERNFKRSRESLQKTVPALQSRKPEIINFHAILAFMNSDFETAGELIDMLESEDKFEAEYVIGRKLLWSINPEAKASVSSEIIVGVNNGNAVISNAYSYMQKGDFKNALLQFKRALRIENGDDITLPTRDGCVVAYNGLALAHIGNVLGKIDGSEPLKKLSLTEFEQLMSYMRSAQMYRTSYAPIYYNFDRLYAAYIFRHLNSKYNYDDLKSLYEKARTELHLIVDNPESSKEYFDILSLETKWLDAVEKSDLISRTAELPVNALWKNRIKFVFHAFACLLAELSANTIDELKFRFYTLSEKFWKVLFNYYPDNSNFKQHYFATKIKIFLNAEDRQFRKTIAIDLFNLLYSDSDKEYMKSFDKKFLKKLKSIGFSYGFR